jgi:hypothetical protein
MFDAKNRGFMIIIAAYQNIQTNRTNGVLMVSFVSLHNQWPFQEPK